MHLKMMPYLFILVGVHKLKSDMVTLGVNNINGLYDSCFTREKLNIDYEHTAFTNLKRVKKVAQSKGYRTTSDVKTFA